MTSNDTPRAPRDEDLTRDDDLTQPLEPIEVTGEHDEAPAEPSDDSGDGASDAGTGENDGPGDTPFEPTTDDPTADVAGAGAGSDDAGPVGATAPLPARDETLVLPVAATRPLATPLPTSPATVSAEAPRPGATAATTAADGVRAGDSPAAAAEHRPTLRVGTVVWGLVLAAIGVGVLAWAGGASIDLQLATIVLLAAAGTALLVGSLVSGARRRR